MNQRVKRVRCCVIIASALACVTATAHALPIIQTVQGGRLAGITRPEIVVKTMATTPATPPGTDVGIVTTFDTGADHFLLRPTSRAALGLANGAGALVNLGGASNLIASTVSEDALTHFDQLRLNPTKSALAKASDATVIVQEHAAFDAVGVDYMVDGTVALYDPQGQPVKTVTGLGTTGNLELLPAMVNGATNPAIAASFASSFAFAADMFAYNGVGPRPTVFGGMKDQANHAVNDVRALWDTGAPTSQIARTLIGTGAGQLDLRLSSDGTRALVPEVRFVSGENTLIIRNLQVVVGDRPADVPLRIGTNVLDQFRTLVDLHDDPTIAGVDRQFGLQREITAYPRSIAKGVNTLDTIGPKGSTVTVNWTDASGAYLLGTDSLPLESSVTLPTQSSGNVSTASVPVVPNALDAVETIVTRGNDIGQIRIEATRARAAATAAAKEAGQVEPLAGAGRDVADVWDELLARGASGITLPVLFAGNGMVEDFVGLGQALYAAVDLGAFIDALTPDSYYRNWINRSFSIHDGRAYDQGNQLLPGFYFGYEPLEFDPLAGAGESIFINRAPAGMQASISAVALAQIGPTAQVPEPGSVGLLVIALIGAVSRRAAPRLTVAQGMPMALSE